MALAMLRVKDDIFHIFTLCTFNFIRQTYGGFTLAL